MLDAWRESERYIQDRYVDASEYRCICLSSSLCRCDSCDVITDMMGEAVKVVGNFLEFTLKFLEIPIGNFTHLGGGEILQH